MNIINLIRLQLRESLGISLLRWYYRKDRKKLWGILGITLMVILSLVPMYIFLYLRLIQGLYDVGVLLNQPQIVLTLVIVFTSIMVMLFGIGFVMAAFYFSRDLPLLIPLPFTPGEIIGAKFFTVLTYEYLTVAPLLLPALWVFGTGQNAGLYYWLAALLVLVLLPVIPLAIISSVILFLMRLTNFGSRKDTLRLLGMFATIGLILGFNYYFTQLPADLGEDFMLNLLLRAEGVVMLIARAFPPALWATRALAGTGFTALLNLGGYLAAALAGLWVMMFLGNRLFYRGLIGGEEVRSGKKLTAAQLRRKTSTARSPVYAVALREIKILVRTPIYLFNSLATLVIMPAAMIVPVVAGGDAIGALLSQIQAQYGFLFSLSGAAFIGVMAWITPAASSSFSREGRLFWISQLIPLDPKEQIKGKILYSFLIALLAVPLVILFSVFFARWTIPELVMTLILGICLCFPAITFSLLIDLFRPYLTWDNPQKAIKQNLNVVIGMAAGFAVLAPIYRLTLWLHQAGRPQWAVYAAIGLSALILGAIPYVIMQKIAAKRYAEISSP